jgi:hypothetical protein
MALRKGCADRQLEIFERADVPELLPRIEAYARQDARREKRTKAGAYPWISAGSWVRHIGRLQAQEKASQDYYDRFAATARALTVERIGECRQLDDLERIERLLAGARRQHGQSRLGRAWTRAELGPLLVETRNRIHLLELGRDRARIRGPRLDPARIPLERLEHLIQRHADLELVDRLRAERNKRICAAVSVP